MLLNDEKLLSGECYGEELLYSHDSYPYHIIGYVKFIWGPEIDESQRKLIIICHPSISVQIKNELEVIFSINKSDTDEVSVVDNIEKNSMEKNDDDNKLHKNFKANQELCQIEMTNSDILNARLKNNGESVTTNTMKMVHHKLDFVMFSLTGPLSFQLLQKVFTFPEHGTDYVDVKGSGATDETKGNRTCWNMSNVKKCTLHNLSVEDPRFHIPHKKQNPFAAPKIGKMLMFMMIFISF